MTTGKPKTSRYQTTAARRWALARTFGALFVLGGVFGALSVTGDNPVHDAMHWLSDLPSDRRNAALLGGSTLVAAVMCLASGLSPRLTAMFYRYDPDEDAATIARVMRLIRLAVAPLTILGIAFVALGASDRAGDGASWIALGAVAATIVVVAVIARAYWRHSEELERQAMIVGAAWGFVVLVAGALAWAALHAAGLVPAAGMIWPAIAAYGVLLVAMIGAYWRLGGFD